MPPRQAPPSSESVHLTAFKAAVTYLAIAVLWLVFTEQILQAVVDTAVRLSRAQLLKSMVFMAMTAGLLYWLVRRSLTAEREGQRNLRDSQARAEALFNGSSDPLFVFPLGADGVAGSFTDVNDSACRQLNVRRDDLLKLRLADVASMPVAQALGGLHTGGRDLRKGELRPPDGSPPVPVEIHARRLSLDDQQLVIATARDLSARQAAERALQESERRYRLLAENANDLIWTLDLDGELAYISPSAERLFGASRKAIRDNPDAFSQEPLTQATRRLIRGASVREQLEISVLHTDGAARWLEVEMNLLRDSAGTVDGVLGIGRDITARRAAEAKERVVLQQLHQAQKMEAIGTLAGGVAHDLNNLLAVILGNAEMAAIDQSVPSKRIDRIQMAAERASSLVQKLLLFSRQQVAEPQPTDVNQVITGLLEMLGQLLGAQIHVEVELSPRLRTVSADPTQLEQVLLNLAVNARDAMPNGGTLRFETDVLELHDQERLPDGAYVRIRVSDTGVGMDDETQARVFEPFFTTKEVGKGTGLGLSTAYGILQDHGGDIRLRSTPGRGTTFSLLVPATDAPIRTPRPAQAPRPAPHITPGRFALVVEDDSMVRGLITEALGRMGFAIATTQTIEDARRYLREEPAIAVLISDVVLPDGVGYELLAERPELPVLMISGYGQEELESRYPAYIPEVPFLRKPFSLKRFAESLRAITGGGGAAPGDLR